MKPAEFINRCHDYYGAYTKYQQKVIYGYLKREQFAERYLDELWQYLVYNFSSQFNSVPDVAILEKARREIAKRPPDWKPPVALLPDEGAEDRSREVKAIMARFKARIKRQKEARAK